jgi:hypothetical protein
MRVASRPNAVGGSELGGDAVSGPKVADNSLKGDDVDESSLGQVPESALAKRLGPFRTYAATVTVPGGVEGNGNAATRSVQRSCAPGEQAFMATTLWKNTATSVEVGDDEELYTVHTFFLDSTTIRTRGGNDTDTDYDLVLQVRCLA